MGLESHIVRTIADDRHRIVPVVGAGLAVDAGIPAGSDLADELAEGARVGDHNGSLWDVCEEIEKRDGRQELERMAAFKVEEYGIRPTRVLELLCRCPTRIVLTTNFDDAIEKSAASVGLSPVPLLPYSAQAISQPSEGEIHVVHLHGRAAEPSSMVLSRSRRQEQLHDPHFQNALRALATTWRLLCLGFRFAPEETHIRQELEWVRSLYRDEEPHLILLPKNEEREDLAILERDGVLTVSYFEGDPGFLAVRQAAQVLAPSQPRAAAAVDRKARTSSPYFAAPALLRERESDEGSDPNVSAAMAELHSSFDEVSKLVEAHRSVVIAPPGMGKTETLLALGSDPASRNALYASLVGLPGAAADTDPAATFAQFILQNAQAFGSSTPRPTLEALDEESFSFLLDGLDECRTDHRDALVKVVRAAAERWPQHSFVVASRPIAEAKQLQASAFALFRIHESEVWGRNYLLSRGVRQAQLNELHEQATTMSRLFAIPMYARFIGEKLVQADAGEMPTSPLALILEAERDAIAREAEKAASLQAELFGWLQGLAVALELQGRNEADADELAAIPGTGTFSSAQARERLIRSALLRDEPEVARFVAVTGQEALCADAILSTHDPVTTLRAVAVAEVGGEEVLRADIEHVIDLVFEGATGETRRGLREIDALRWARTQRADGPVEQVTEAMSTIREWFTEKRLWRELGQENQLRGAGRALVHLSRAHPEVAESWRSDLVAETSSIERTVRGNAIEFLTLLPADERTADWLLPLLQDSDDVVRRIAAHAVEHFGLSEAKNDLREAWGKETDELAFEAVGCALIALSPDSELPELVRVLAEQPVGWERVDYEIRQRLTRDGVLDVLDEGALDLAKAFELLDHALEDEDVDWSEAQVERLAKWVASTGYESHRLRRDEGLARLAARHPQAALRGARVGAKDATWYDLFWLRHIELEELSKAAHGTLEGPLQQFIETRRPRERGEFEEPAHFSDAPHADRPRPRLEDLMRQERVSEDAAPHPSVIWGAEGLPAQLQAKLLALAEHWYPKSPAEEHTSREGQTRTINNGLIGAVTCFAALDVSITQERWLDLFSAGIFSYDRRIADWARKQFRSEWTEAAAEAIRGLDPEDLGEALTAIPVWDGALADALGEAILRSDDEFVAESAVKRIGEAGRADLLRRVASDAKSERARRQALTTLASLGDVKAQTESLASMARELAANPLSHERSGIEWANSASSPTLLPALCDLLRLLHRQEDALMTRRSIEAAIDNIGGQAALNAYQELIEDKDLDGGQFYWYQRNRLAREIARQSVLARLPSTLVETITWFRGFEDANSISTQT